MKQLLIYKRLAVFLIIINLSILLTGCYDQREIDDLVYPLAIGLDLGEANILRMSLQLAAPLQIEGGGGEGGGGGGGQGEGSAVITIDTPSIYSGLNLINNIVSKEINMSHTKVVVISRKLAEEGISKYMYAINRSREFRPDIFVVVSNCPADEYLENVKPILESNPAKYYELLFGKNFSSYYPLTTINKFYYEIISNDIEPVAVFSDIGKYNKSDEIEKPEKGLDLLSMEYGGQLYAGNVPVAANRENEAMGMAVFKNDKMVGVGNGLESACYRMIVGDYDYSYWTLIDPFDENLFVIITLSKRNKPKIKVTLNEGVASINITLDFEGDITSIQSGYNYEDHPEILEESIKEMLKTYVMEFLKKTTDVYDSDICGFGTYVKGKFLTLEEWEDFNWQDKYKDTEFDVKINFKVRRTGLMVKSAKVNEQIKHGEEGR